MCAEVQGNLSAHAEAYSAAAIMHGPVSIAMRASRAGFGFAGCREQASSKLRIIWPGAASTYSLVGYEIRRANLSFAGQPRAHRSAAPRVTFYVFIEQLARRLGLNPTERRPSAKGDGNDMTGKIALTGAEVFDAISVTACCRAYVGRHHFRRGSRDDIPLISKCPPQWRPPRSGFIISRQRMRGVFSMRSQTSRHQDHLRPCAFWHDLASATLITDTPDHEASDRCRIEARTEASRFLGLHVEGPHLSTQKNGALGLTLFAP